MRAVSSYGGKTQRPSEHFLSKRDPRGRKEGRTAGTATGTGTAAGTGTGEERKRKLKQGLNGDGNWNVSGNRNGDMDREGDGNESGEGRWGEGTREPTTSLKKESSSCERGGDTYGKPTSSPARFGARVSTSHNKGAKILEAGNKEQEHRVGERVYAA